MGSGRELLPRRLRLKVDTEVFTLSTSSTLSTLPLLVRTGADGWRRPADAPSPDAPSPASKPTTEQQRVLSDLSSYGARRQVLNTLKRVLWGGYKPKCRYGNQFCLSASENNVRESLNIFFSFETKNRLSASVSAEKMAKTSLIRGCLLLFR